MFSRTPTPSPPSNYPGSTGAGPRHYRLKPTRLLRPWDSPGKSAGVGAIAFSRATVHSVAKTEIQLKQLSSMHALALSRELNDFTRVNAQNSASYVIRTTFVGNTDPGETITKKMNNHITCDLYHETHACGYET